MDDPTAPDSSGAQPSPRPTTQPPRLYPPSKDRPPVLDLRERWLDVRKIAKSQPEFAACVRAGWDADDLVSEVYARALARQSMASRYDPARAGVSKYLTVLCRGILLNLLDSKRRRDRHEQIGSHDVRGEPCDASLTAVDMQMPDDASVYAGASTEDCDDAGEPVAGRLIAVVERAAPR
jgi:hypothetical protein